MLTVVDPTGAAPASGGCRGSGADPGQRHSRCCLRRERRVLYVLAAGVLGGGQLAAAGLFWQRASDFHARLLLRASLVYLPTLLVMLMLAPWI